MPTTTPFNNLITFSRGSNATVTGSNGLIQWAPSNVLTFSEQFDNAAWQKFGGGVATAPAVTANAGVAPDGTTTADRVQFTLNGGTTSTDRSLLSQSATLATSFPYTYSIWVRSLTGTLSMGIGCDNLVGNTPITVTTEWQRFTVSGIATGTAGVALLQLRGGQTPVQSNAADVLVWGAQLEIGSTATTYNPTTVKNLLGFSEAFDNAAWTKTNTSIVTGAQANPINGLFNAQKLMENTANAEHFCLSTNATISSANLLCTSSVFIKAGERTRVQVRAFSNGTPIASADFNLSTLTFSGITAGSWSYQTVGNGWYRISCSVVHTNIGSNGIGVFLINSAGVISYIGDGNSGVYIYGAQLSDSASLDPYVPTPGAAPSSTAFYGPRFDFDPVTLQPRGLLVEEQRTNLLVRSEEFDNASWNKTRSSVTANATTSPGGTANADKLVEDTTPSSTHGLNQVFTGTAVSHTFTTYAKAGERSQIRMRLYDGTAFVNETYFNLATGTVGSGTGGIITNVGNGWYRCSVTATLAASASCQAQVFLAVSGSDAYTGDGTSGAFLYGAQLEAGAFATSYIPTVASTVTRSADVATITGQNFGQWYRQDEGAFVAEFDALTSASLGSANVLSAYASGTNLNRIWMWTGAPGVVRNSVVSGGSGVSELTGATLVANTPLKAASSYRVDSYAFTTNGGAVGSDTSGALPVGISVLGVGNIGGPSEYLNGHIRNIRFIPARAADFQLQGLST